MQDRVVPRGWIERRKTERLTDADTPIGILGAALIAYGNPVSSSYAQRGIRIALAFGVLSKPNRSQAIRTRLTSPFK